MRLTERVMCKMKERRQEQGMVCLELCGRIDQVMTEAIIKAGGYVGLWSYVGDHGDIVQCVTIPQAWVDEAQGVTGEVWCVGAGDVAKFVVLDPEPYVVVELGCRDGDMRLARVYMTVEAQAAYAVLRDGEQGVAI